MQLLHEYAHILAVVDRRHDQMQTALLKSSFEHVLECPVMADAPALGAIRLRVSDKIRIAEIQSEVGKSIDLLFPPDHPVGAILEYEDDEIELEPHRRLKLLGI